MKCFETARFKSDDDQAFCVDVLELLLSYVLEHFQPILVCKVDENGNVNVVKEYGLQEEKNDDDERRGRGLSSEKVELSCEREWVDHVWVRHRCGHKVYVKLRHY